MTDQEILPVTVQNQTGEIQPEMAEIRSMSAEVLDAATHLYRHFDKDGVLLYVGISLSAIKRLGEHKDCSHWFNSIARVDIQQFPTRQAALAAERIAISTEMPKHNIYCRAAIPVERRLADKETKKDSKVDLLRRLVRFDVIYKENEIPLPIRRGLIRKYMDDGKLGFIDLPNSRGTKMNRYVTGWQLISFLEWLESMSGER
jgi:hypothetical protein